MQLCIKYLKLLVISISTIGNIYYKKNTFWPKPNLYNRKM